MGGAAKPPVESIEGGARGDWCHSMRSKGREVKVVCSRSGQRYAYNIIDGASLNGAFWEELTFVVRSSAMSVRVTNGFTLEI